MWYLFSLKGQKPKTVIPVPFEARNRYIRTVKPRKNTHAASGVSAVRNHKHDYFLFTPEQ